MGRGRDAVAVFPWHVPDPGRRARPPRRGDPVTATDLIRHRPHGIEHPYATSLDQRIPVQPLVGESVLLGVQAMTELTSLTCDWESPSAGPVTLHLTPHAADAADTAALAGGE